MTEETFEQAADRAAADGDFGGARSILERAVLAEADHRLWIKLSAVCKAMGDLRGGLDAVDRALSIAPLDFAALLYRATLLEALTDPTAAQAFGHALAQEPPESELPIVMRPAVAHARKRWEAHQAALEQRLLNALPQTLSPVQRERAERFISNTSRRTKHFHQQPSHFHYPGLPEIEFHDRAMFPELDVLDRTTEFIRAEFNALIAAEAAEIVPYIQYPEHVPLRQWRELNQSSNWNAIHLLKAGQRVDANARHCPRTMQVLSELPQPEVPGASPNAMFSLLAPRTRIPPHTGVANTRLVCHLPLIVPPNCGFRCGATVRDWRVGESIIFDDTIEHEAWNDSDDLRVVFILDLWVPALGAQERAVIESVIPASGATFGDNL